MNKVMVMAKAAPGRREDLAHWYDTQHFGDMLAVPGIVGAERHAVTVMKQPCDVPAWDFMLIYEIDGDPMAVLGTMAGMLGTERMPTSDALESSSNLFVVGHSACERRSDG